MPHYADRYNVSWPSPSDRPADAMPVGNGDLAANVLTEANGDVVVTLAKGDALDESATLLKLGRIRLRLSPRLRRDREPFRQTLQVDQATVHIQAGSGDAARHVRIWVDAHAPVLVLEVDSPVPVHVLAALESWRTADRDLEEVERGGHYGWLNGPQPPRRRADTVVADANDHLVWYHHNTRSCWAEAMALQGLTGMGDYATDPLLGRTFGCLLRGRDCRRLDQDQLRTQAPTKSTRLLLVAHTAQVDAPAKWLRDIVQLGSVQADRDWTAGREAHLAWWNAFWERSYVHLGPLTEKSEQSLAYRISRGYQLQRYLNACAGRSTDPIHMNGSLFTFETNVKGEAVDADFRRWGSLYSAQNLRLAYWPMLASGDWDLMQPYFRLYTRALPLARQRCLHFYGHDGAHYPELMTFWGGLSSDSYGWNRDGLPPEAIQSDFIRHHVTGMLELLAVMADYVLYTRDRSFAQDTLIPMAREVLLFFAEHYDTDADGRLRLAPAQALETYTQDVTNPMPDVAGLHWVIDRLLGPLAAYADVADLLAWRRLRGQLPPLPIAERDGELMLQPAATYTPQSIDTETPDLYAVFPFRLWGIGQENLDVAIRSYRRRHFRHSSGRQTTGVVAARLAQFPSAWEALVEHLATRPSESRFPAYWGPHFNWIPDQDQGNVGMLILQQMLLQDSPGQLHALPCWPDDVDLHFRLRAAGGVTVEATVVGGRVVRCHARDADGAAQPLRIHPLQHRSS